MRWSIAAAPQSMKLLSSPCNSTKSIVATGQESLVQWSNRNFQYGTNILHFQTISAPINSLSFSKPTLGANRIFSSRCSVHDQLDSVNKTVVGLDPSFAVKNKAAELSSELKGTSIFLVGINNNIKTKLGNVLADALRYYYFDSESLVEQAAGESAVVLRGRDEKGFLESETEVLKQLSSMGRLVVCTGDDAVQSSTNLALMRHGISIWIDIPIPVIARGLIESSSQTPSYAMTSDHSEILSKLNADYEQMKERYAIADAKISLEKVACQLGYDTTEEVSTEDMALEVFVEIEKLTRVKKMMEDAARPF